MSDPPKPRVRSALVAAARRPAAPSTAAKPEPQHEPQTSASTSGQPQSRNIIPLSGAGSSFVARPSSQPQEGSVSPQKDATQQSAAGPSSQAPSRASSISGGSVSAVTPGPEAGGSKPALGKMKFKPKVPLRRVKAEPDVKPDVSSMPSSSAIRGAPRGRGRGSAPRGRGGANPSISVAAGVFGGSRPSIRNGSTPSRRFAPAPATRVFDLTEAEVYSDPDDDDESGHGGIIDIDQVSSLHESAPTSLLRNRKADRAKTKSEDREGGSGSRRSKSKSRNRKSRETTSKMEVEPSTVEEPGVDLVKAEPISPVKRPAQLSDLFANDEAEGSSKGRRVREFARDGGIDGDGGGEQVNEANKVDLSESESEEEEEDLTGDFIPIDGNADPSERIYTFQFPHLFPHFKATGPVDLTGADEDVKPDIKPTAAQLRAKKRAPPPPPPEGRIGTLVVMKSGKVKMVLGNDIVMNVDPGVQSNFLQQLVHFDTPSKSATVLGEVHKQFNVTPDIDRLLHELYINGGKTPGDMEAENAKMIREVKKERGLTKMEVD